MSVRDLDIGWLRLFEALGRHGNLTRVAEVRGLTQPAVSYQLKRLEEELGCALVRRLHRGIELTEEGKLLYEAVKESVDRIDGAVRQIRRRDRGQTVRIHTDFGFASYWLMPRINDFRRLEPEIDVQVVASQSLEGDNAADADLKVIFGAVQNVGDKAVQLIAEDVAPVCSPAFLAKYGPFDSIEDLAAQPLLHLDGDTHMRWFTWESWLAEGGVRRKPKSGDLSLNAYNLVIQAALSEQGIALGWSGLVDDLVKSRVLVRCGPSIRREDHGYWLLSPQPDPVITNKLIRWLVEESSKTIAKSSRTVQSE